MYIHNNHFIEITHPALDRVAKRTVYNPHLFGGFIVEETSPSAGCRSAIPRPLSPERGKGSGNMQFLGRSAPKTAKKFFPPPMGGG
jgi:hypothetical protein